MMNIFYADDDVDDRELFCDAVQQIDPTIKVVLSRDGQEAVEILKSQEPLPDLIFLDINMPRMNGLECMAELKSDDRLINIPIIIHSTTVDRDEVRQLLTLGADRFLPKEYSFDKLKTSLQNILVGESLN